MPDTVQDAHRQLTYNLLIIHFCALVYFRRGEVLCASARCGKIHAAMLPIGAYAPRWFMRPQHMDPADAVRAFSALGAERFIAMHWGNFKLTNEHLREPPELLRETWKRETLPR